MMLHLPMIQPPPEAEKQVPPATEWKFPPEPPTQMTGGSYVPCGAPVYAPPCLRQFLFPKEIKADIIMTMVMTVRKAQIHFKTGVLWL